MEIELVIRADSMAEIAHLFAPVPTPEGEPVRATIPEPRLKEVEPEETAPKKSRKGSRSAKQDTEASPTEGDTTGPTATSDASPSESVTFQDLRDAAGPLMEAGRGKEIQDMLLAKFEVRAFGALNENQYPQALAELQNLAA